MIDEALARNPAATVAEVRQYASERQTVAEGLLEEQEAQIERAACDIAALVPVAGRTAAGRRVAYQEEDPLVAVGQHAATA